SDSRGLPVALEAGIPARALEIERQLDCGVCLGDWKQCRLSVCPYLGNVRKWFTDQPGLSSTDLFGASPPSAFVGSWGYQRLLAGACSARPAPTGPSAVIRKLELAENPSVPRRVDAVVSDTDLRATAGVVDLYRHGITQSHITRVFSVGLLGGGKRRRLVPTE